MGVMMEQRIVERVNTYCRYVNPGFFISNRGANDLRLVIKYREANKYVNGIESELLCIYDSIVTLPNSVFTMLDIKSAFYTVKLDEISQDYLCFKVNGQIYRP